MYDGDIMARIEELRERLALLRRRRDDSAAAIGIAALEEEIARTAARLPREWDLFAGNGVAGEVAEDRDAVLVAA